MNPSSRYGFELFFKEDEKYYFQFNDARGEPILFSSRGYASEKSRLNGIRAVIRASASKEHYERKQNAGGEYYFILKSGNKKLCRSLVFSSQEEAEDKAKLMLKMGKDVPIFNREDFSEKSEKTAKESPKTVEEPPKVVKESPKATKKSPEIISNPVNLPTGQEGVGKMPRYKYSIIYYPESKVWSITSDFSGDSKQLKTCDGQQIEAFLKVQLPEEERKALQIHLVKQAIAKNPPKPESKPSVGSKHSVARPRAVIGELKKQQQKIVKTLLRSKSSTEIKKLVFKQETLKRQQQKIVKSLPKPKPSTEIKKLVFKQEMGARGLERQQQKNIATKSETEQSIRDELLAVKQAIAKNL